MKTFRINFNREACIGCGSCTTVCSNWVIDENKAKPKKIEISEKELENNKEAEELCPTGAIKIEE